MVMDYSADKSGKIESPEEPSTFLARVSRAIQDKRSIIGMTGLGITLIHFILPGFLFL